MGRIGASVPSEVPVPSDLVVMGRLNRPYGVRGWIRVEVYTEYIDSLLDFPVWWVKKYSERDWLPIKIAEGKIYQQGLVVKFDGVDSPEAAQAWGRASVSVSRADFPVEDASEEDIYWIDLIGMEVKNAAGVLYGRVDHLLETGAHDVLCVKGPLGEQLIPYTDPFLVSVDKATKSIVVDWEWQSDSE